MEGREGGMKNGGREEGRMKEWREGRKDEGMEGGKKGRGTEKG